jgi:hypothetical protein
MGANRTGVFMPIRNLIRLSWVAMICLGATCTSIPALAGEAKFTQGSIQVVPSKDIYNTLLMVSGPNGYFTEEFVERGLPEIKLTKFGKLEDGTYRWQITGATQERREVHKSELNNGRGDIVKNMRNIGLKETGVFYVRKGQITRIDLSKKEPVQVNKDKKND